MYVGVVTRVDDNYFYVWAVGNGHREYRCRRVPDKEFKQGEMISFTSPRDNAAVLDATRCEKHCRQLVVSPSRNCMWKAQTLVTFAPKDFDHFKLIRSQVPECKALAFSEDFFYVACFAENSHIQIGAVYESYVTRVPQSSEELIPKLGTLFCIVNRFRKIHDPVKIRELLRNAPWTKIMGSNGHSATSTSKNDLSVATLQKRPFVPKFKEMGSSEFGEQQKENTPKLAPKENVFSMDVCLERNGTNANTKNQETAARPNFNTHPYGLNDANIETRLFAEPTNKNIPTTLQSSNIDTNEEQKIHTGLVVENDAQGLVIWSKSHDLVRAPALPEIGLEKRWPVSSWVDYRAFLDETAFNSSQPIQRNNRCRYTAYDILKSEFERKVEFSESSNKIRMQGKLTGPLRYIGADLMLAAEPFLGTVLCARDKRLVQQLEYGLSAELTVYLTFTKEYPDLCRWVALAMKCLSESGDEEWFELEKPLVNNSPSLHNRNGENCDRAYEVLNDTDTCRISWDEPIDEAAAKPDNKAPKKEKFLLDPQFEKTLQMNQMNAQEKISDKVFSDVLGICIGHKEFTENSPGFSNFVVTTSLVATKRGLVRQNSNLPIGVWVQARITRSEEPDEEYRIIQSGKIKPPISTRVVKARFLDEDAQAVLQPRGGGAFERVSEECIILCTKLYPPESPSTDFSHPILGSIHDPYNKSNKCSLNAGVAEIGVKWFGPDEFLWFVLRYHKTNADDVWQIPFNQSVCSKDLGRTCDDFNSIYIENAFEEKLDRNGSFGNGAEKNYPIYEAETNAYQKFVSHHLNSISTDFCDFSLNSTHPSSSNSPTTNNQIASMWDEINIVNGGDFSRQRKSPKTMPKIIEIDDVDARRSCDMESDYIRQRQMLIDQELRSYAPVMQKHDHKRSTGIIVQKTLHYAVIYATDVGVSIIIANHFPSLQQYDSACTIGSWLSVTFASVTNKFLVFNKMCIPKFERVRTSNYRSRISINGRLQVLVRCDISLNNLSVHEGGFVRNAGGFHLLNTSFAKILLNERFIFEKKLSGSVVNIWISYMENSSEHGPFWEIEDDADIANNDDFFDGLEFDHAVNDNRVGLSISEFTELFKHKEKVDFIDLNNYSGAADYNVETSKASCQTSPTSTTISICENATTLASGTLPKLNDPLQGFSIYEYAKKYLSEDPKQSKTDELIEL